MLLLLQEQLERLIKAVEKDDVGDLTYLIVNKKCNVNTCIHYYEYDDDNTVSYWDIVYVAT